MNFADAVLLMSEGGPIQMKIPSGMAFVGFADEELGRRALSAFAVEPTGLSFTKIASLSSTLSEEKSIPPVIFFRSTEDLALFAKDRRNFPYRELAISFDAFSPKG